MERDFFLPWGCIYNMKGLLRCSCECTNGVKVVAQELLLDSDHTTWSRNTEPSNDTLCICEICLTVFVN
jgi:hypothetical protein